MVASLFDVMNTNLRTLLTRPLLVATGFSLVINLLMLAPAMFILQVFDRVLTSQSRETLWMLVLGVAIALLFIGALEYLRGRLQGVMGNLVHDALSPVVSRVTLAQAAKRDGPVPMQGLRDVASLRALFSAQGLLAVLDAPWAVVYLAVIWVAHPWMGMAATSAALFMLVLAIVNDRITRKQIAELQREAGKASIYLESSLQNAEVVQAMGMGDSLLGRWQHMSHDLAQSQKSAARRSVGMTSFTRFTRQWVQIALQALAAYLVLIGETTPGVLVASTILLGRALAPVEQVVGSWKVLAEGRLAYERLMELLDKAPKPGDHMRLPAPQGALSAQNLMYRIPNSDRFALAGVSLQLDKGESLAIIGPSGAGKSTLVRLLTGVWAPSAGVVRLDGADLASWPREEIGPHIGYVPQDVELFAGTVAENIARLGPVNPDWVVQASKLAGTHELVLNLPKGYDTQIDPHGAMLSPGQRQRLAVARALYGSPKVLILDEPNANLDGAGEQLLAQTLKQLAGRITVVVVTHRTTLTQHVDKMLVLENGRAAHYGPVGEVVQALRGGQAPGATPRVVAGGAKGAAA